MLTHVQKMQLYIKIYEIFIKSFESLLIFLFTEIKRFIHIIIGKIFQKMFPITFLIFTWFFVLTYLTTNFNKIIYCSSCFLLLYLISWFQFTNSFFFLFFHHEKPDEHTVRIRRKPPKARSCRQPSRPLRSLDQWR